MKSINCKNSSQKNCINNSKKLSLKKKWREQQYNNKKKVLQWENFQQRQAFRQYNKELKKLGVNVSELKLKTKIEKHFKSSFEKAQLQYQKIQEEREQKKKQKELDKKKREEAIRAYKEKKALRHQKLFSKNKYGRPSMKGRLELLLEKIEKEYGKGKNTT